MFFLTGLWVLIAGFQCWNHLIAITSNKKVDLYPADIQISNAVHFGLCLLFFLVSAISARVRQHLPLAAYDALDPNDEQSQPCIAKDKLGGDQQTTSPERFVSFIRRMTYSWMLSLVIKGYRNPLKLTDLWLLDQRNTSEVVGPAFITNLDKHVKPRQKRRCRRLSAGSPPLSSDPGNSHQLQRRQSVQQSKLKTSSPALRRASDGAVLKVSPDLRASTRHSDSKELAIAPPPRSPPLSSTVGSGGGTGATKSDKEGSGVDDKHQLSTNSVSFKPTPSYSSALFSGAGGSSTSKMEPVSDGGAGGASVNHTSSLLLAMLKTYWPSLIFSGSLKLIHDIIVFVNPIILKALLNFIQHRDSEPVWHGYFYAAGMFVSACCQSFILQRYFYAVSLLGMHIRTGLVTAVYRKSLFLTNSARNEATTGQITNLMSTDAQQFVLLMPFFHIVWSGPFQIVVAIVLLWRELGVAVLAGVGVLFLLLPINILVARASKRIQEKKSQVADSRIKLISELLNGIRVGFTNSQFTFKISPIPHYTVVKLYAWENSFMKEMNALRASEVRHLRNYTYLNGISFLWTSAPFLVGVSSFGVYVLMSDRNILDAQKAFVSLTLFNILRFPLFIFPMVTSQLIQAYVSLKRLSTFLSHPEVDSQPYSTEHTPGVAAVIERASFSWDVATGNNGQAIEPVLKNISIAFPEGQLTTIMGAVGSGKSSLLQALLGQMERLAGKVNINGTVAYVPQEPWIFNATLRANILFHKPYDSIKYQRVIEACALESDLEILDQGDLTEIGDKGINLSGGQKQRISLARACYADADVYLLDDPLSAVDAHVGLHLLKSVLSRQTGLLRSHTVLLATHSVKAVDFSQRLVFLANGRLVETLTSHQLEASRLGVGGGKSRLCDFLDCCRQRDSEEHEEKQQLTEDDNNSSMLLRRSIASPLADKQQSLSPSSAQNEDAILSSQSTLHSHDSSLPPSPSHHHQQGRPRAVSVSSDNVSQFDLSAYMYDTTEGRFDDQQDGKKGGGGGGGVDEKNMNNSHVDKKTTDAKSGDAKLSSSSAKRDKLDESASNPAKNQLTSPEQAFTGRVKLSVFAIYFRNMNYWICALIVLLFASVYVSNWATSWWLAQWSNDAELDANVTMRLPPATSPISIEQALKNDTELASAMAALEARRNYRLGIYGVFGVVQMLVTMAATYTYATAHLACARRLHGLLLYGVLRAPIQYFDTVPQGRIVNRFSSDIASVDMPLFQAIRGLLNMLFGCLLSIIMACTINTWMFIPVFMLMGVYIYLQNLYVTTSRQLKRIESITRSPIFSNFTETLLGVNTIRAYQMCTTYMNINAKHLDANNRPTYFSILSQRWLAILLELVGNTVILFVAVFSVTSPQSVQASYSGLVLSYVLGLSQSLNWLVRMSADVESEIVAVERIDEYSKVKSEAPWECIDYQPPDNWPNGGIEFENYATRYREGLDLVLKSINLRISAGQRVGIVGRTGSGKSSLVMGLFRMIEPAQGKIVIDNLDTGKLGLHDLRSRLTLIPQDPVLFSGTLRFNLDPFEQHSDEAVWSALDQANLKTFVRESGNGLGLNMPVTEGGSSISLGQRQLVCLARALLRRTSILVLDEATAAVDPATDSLIQQTIRSSFANATVLTIAHRINTIMDYDRIIFLEKGEIVETGNPMELASNPTTRFAALAQAANQH